MAQQIRNNGETGLVARTKTNENFTELYTDKLTSTQLTDLTDSGDTTLHYHATERNKIDYVVPEDFGAVGDGVADDTSKMLLAFANPKVKLTDSKTYLMDGEVFEVTNDLELFGTGTIKNAVLNASGATTNIKLDGINSDNLAINVFGNEIESLKVHNCNFYDVIDNVIAIKNAGIGTLEVIDNTFADVYLGIGGSDTIDNSGSAVYVLGGTEAIGSCVIRGNIINRIRGGTVIFLQGAFTWVDVDTNYMKTIAQRGIGFWSAVTTTKGIVRHNIIKTNATYKPSGVGQGVGCNGIYSNVDLLEVDVVNNTVIDVYENGIEGNFRSIKDNYVENTGIDLINYPTPSIEGIYTAKCKNISGNRILNTAGNGIYCFTSGDTLEDISIYNNDIRNDVYDDSHSAIVVRGVEGDLTTISNIRVFGNTIDNFEIAVDLPTVKPVLESGGVATYTNVKVGINYATNYDQYFSGKWTIDLTNNGNYVDWIANNLFSDGLTITGWASSNAVIGETLVVNHNIPRVTADDDFNGRIRQDIFTPIPDIGNRFMQLELSLRGTGTQKFVRIYELDVNGANPTSAVTYIFPIKSDTVFNKYTVLVNLEGYIRIEIANQLDTEWFEIESIQSKYIDMKV